MPTPITPKPSSPRIQHISRFTSINNRQVDELINSHKILPHSALDPIIEAEEEPMKKENPSELFSPKTEDIRPSMRQSVEKENLDSNALKDKANIRSATPNPSICKRVTNLSITSELFHLSPRTSTF